MKKILKIFCSFLIAISVNICVVGLYAQTTKIKGRVIEESTGEGIPLANVYFKGTTIGVSADMEGYFSLETRDTTVSELIAEMMGYEPQSIIINRGAFNQISFKLKIQENFLSQIVIKPDNRYTRSILKKIESAKIFNDPQQQDRYDCEVYNKMELDISNADKRLKNRLLRKNFGFVLDYIDTSVISGQSYLPIMISESRSHIYHQKNPAIEREVIEASRISGVEDEFQFAQFTGNMHVKINFYDDFISIFDVKIPSPVGSANVFYDYYLIDSLQVDGRKTYLIRFHPAKFISSPAFDGEMRIDAKDYAIKSIKATLKKGANVNWIRGLALESEFQKVDDSVWFYKQDKLYADFSITMADSSNLISFLGHKQVNYLNPRFDTKMPKKLANTLSQVTFEKEGFEQDESYWKNARPYPLSQKESNIYKMVDSIKNVPLYRDLYTIVSTFVNGYYNTKYFGIGPYFKLFSFNNLEGARFQLGGRTTNDFSKKYRLNLYAAYGTKDKKIKGGAKLEWMFNNHPTKKLSVEAKYDVLQLGKGANALTDGNIFSSILSKVNSQRLSPVSKFSISYQHEWRENFDNAIAIESERIYSNRYVPMFTKDSIKVNSVASNQLHYQARISWKETITRGAFDKYYVNGKYPVISLDLIASVNGISRNDYSYFRAEANIDYKLHLPPAGTSYFKLSGGKIFGKVPYPFLKLHEGNGTYFFDKSAFACMDFYEFASDSWATLFWEHNFKGFFLGKIPIMRRLQWREIFTFKMGYGTLSKKNNGITDNIEYRYIPQSNGLVERRLDLSELRAPILFPEGMSSLSKPYIEMGVGVSNILRVIRVDLFWRMTHRNKTIHGEKIKSPHRFAVNFGLEFRF